MIEVKRFLKDVATMLWRVARRSYVEAVQTIKEASTMRKDKDATDVPRRKETKRRRSSMEDSLNQVGDEGMFPHQMTVVKGVSR